MADKNIDGPYHWPEEMEKQAKVKPAYSGTGECATLGGDCSGGSGAECEEYFDGNIDPLGKNAFWIFKAIGGFHAKVDSMYTAIAIKGLLSSLNIGQLIDDLGGGPQEDSTFPDVAGWLASAIGLGGSVTGTSSFKGKTAVSTGLSILSSITAMVAKAEPEEEEGVDAAGIESALESVLKATLENMETILELAMGNVQDETAYEKLPVPEGSEEGDTPIGTFFSNGWALLHKDSDPSQDVKNAMVQGIRAKIVDLILQDIGYMLVGMEQDQVEGGCPGGDGSGEYMLETNNGDSYCFYIAKPYEPNNVEYLARADTEILQIMSGAGIESPYAYYKEILKCQRPRDSEAKDYQPDGEPQEIGQVAKCLFNMPTAIVADTDRCDFYLGDAGVTPCTDYELKDIE